jgi:hypothetical protein
MEAVKTEHSEELAAKEGLLKTHFSYLSFVLFCGFIKLQLFSLNVFLVSNPKTRTKIQPVFIIDKLVLILTRFFLNDPVYDTMGMLSF